MLKTGDILPLGFGAFSIFAMLAGLTLLVGADQASPGCTGPEVQRCDYVASASEAVARSRHHRFQSDLGFEIFDQGSSVLVQQFTPPGEPSLNHAPSVLIDKKSCRACAVDGHRSTRGDPRDPWVGPLVTRVPAQDPAAARERARRWEDGPGGVAVLLGQGSALSRFPDRAAPTGGYVLQASLASGVVAARGVEAWLAAGRR